MHAHIRHLKWSSKYKNVLSVSDYHNATSTHDKANLITFLCTQCGLLLQVVLNFCVNEPILGEWNCKVQTPDGVVDYFVQFSICIKKKLLFRYQVFPQPLITITIARCPANFINLSAIIVDLWLSEYRSKLKHDSQIAIRGGTLDIFKIPSKKEY